MKLSCVPCCLVHILQTRDQSIHIRAKRTQKHEDPWLCMHLDKAHKPDRKPFPNTSSADGVCTGNWEQLVTWHVRAFPCVLTSLSHLLFFSLAAVLILLNMETVPSFLFLEGTPQYSSVKGPVIWSLASVKAITQWMCPEFTVVLWSYLCFCSNGVLGQWVPEGNETWLFK